MKTPSRAAAIGIAVSALLGAGCGKGLLFAEDARLRIVSPRDLATVSTPVRLRWVNETPARRTLMYAVFVDSLPVHPGQSLRSLAEPSCASVPSCVDVAWLNRHHVYVTSEPSLDLHTLPVRGTSRGESDIHTATIVVVDAAWYRQGEAVWSVTFGLRDRPGP